MFSVIVAVLSDLARLVRLRQRIACAIVCGLLEGTIGIGGLLKAASAIVIVSGSIAISVGYNVLVASGVVDVRNPVMLGRRVGHMEQPARAVVVIRGDEA